MGITRRIMLGLLACALACPSILRSDRADADILVADGNPFRLGEGQPGGQSGAALAPEGTNNVIGAWLNVGAGGQRARIRYYSKFGIPFPSQFALGEATGLTGGGQASSVFPVSFADETALILFAAERRNGPRRGGRDIFAQRVDSRREKVGVPIAVNQTIAGNQTRILATRLSNDNVMVAWLSHAAAPGSFDIRGRVIRNTAAGVSPDRRLTVDTPGAQAPTALAALANGLSALAYTVRSGAGAGLKQDVLVQKLSPAGARVGPPILLKRTIGQNAFGGAGVAGLPGGRFVAVWFADGPGDTAALKRRIFRADGTPGPLATVDTRRVRAAAQTAPKVVATSEGIIVTTEGFAAGVHSIDGWLLDAQGRLESGPRPLASGRELLTNNSLAHIPSIDIYYAGLTRGGSSPTASRAFAKDFYISPGCDVRC